MLEMIIGIIMISILSLGLILSIGILVEEILKQKSMNKVLSASDLIVLSQKENTKNIEKFAKKYYIEFQKQYLKTKKTTFVICYRDYSVMDEKIEEREICNFLLESEQHMNLFLKYFQDNGWFVEYKKTKIPEEPHTTNCYQLLFTLSSEPKE